MELYSSECQELGGGGEVGWEGEGERKRWERERQVQYIQESTAITWVNR